MTTRTSEGMCEITANERRLQSTKRAVAAAAKHDKTAQDALKASEAAFKIAEAAVKAARKNANDARNKLSVSQADQKDAEGCLKAAQKKWEVVDLVGDNGGDKTYTVVEESRDNVARKRDQDSTGIQVAAIASNKKSRTGSWDS
jgi:Tfp pilus assembly protein PilX